MKYLIILANPDNKSISYQLNDEIQSYLNNNNHEVCVRDLYETCFDPILSRNDLLSIKQNRFVDDIGIEQINLKWADYIIFINPLWWGNVPAITKGYLDRVFINNIDVSKNDIEPIKQFNGKKALLIFTSAESKDDLDAKGIIDNLKNLYQNSCFNFVGIELIDIKVLDNLDDKENINSKMEEFIPEVIKLLNIQM